MRKIISVILSLVMLLSVTNVVSAENDYFPASLYIDDVYMDIDLEITKLALDRLKVDSLGLDQTDYNLLRSIIEKFIILFNCITSSSHNSKSIGYSISSLIFGSLFSS